VRFWDSSALVPLCLEQPSTERARALYQQDSEIVVWWASPVECASAFARLRREDVLDDAGRASALGVLQALQGAWYEVVPGDALRAHALRLLRLHPLRSADALQLAAAIEWAGVPAGGDLVSFDERLKAAARLEGFTTTD